MRKAFSSEPRKLGLSPQSSSVARHLQWLFLSSPHFLHLYGALDVEPVLIPPLSRWKRLRTALAERLGSGARLGSCAAISPHVQA